MATSTFNARVKHKRDTSANWTANNPVLLDGEIILVDTPNGALRFKIGDGTSTYSQLPFANGTAYALSMSNNVITLTDSDGATSSVTLPVYNGGVV